MRKKGLIGLAAAALIVGVAAVWLLDIDLLPYKDPGPLRPGGATAESIKHGAYLAAAAGCVGCHTAKDGTPFSGGRVLETPFGNFLTPNITPDPVHGIGKFTDADFVRALHQGKAPDSRVYFPAFPYPSYTKISESDALDIKDYLFSLKPDAKANQPHQLKFPYSIRFGVRFWRLMYFKPQSPPADRGRYLIEALGHCGECHHPRDSLGGVIESKAFAGQPELKIPAITPAALKDWTAEDLDAFFQDGSMPDGDYVGGEMAEVVRNSTSKLTNEDRAALISTLLKAKP